MHKNEHGQPVGFPATDWTGAIVPGREPMTGHYTELHTVTDLQPICSHVRPCTKHLYRMQQA